MAHFRDSENLTRWVRILLYAQIVVAIASLISGYLEYQLLLSLQNGTFEAVEIALAESAAGDRRQLVVGVVYLILLIVSAVVILKWIHRANYNARQLGAKGMDFTPGWAVGYYFIPILNLFKPYRAMKEIWKASKNPSRWATQPASRILPLWWGLWITSNILGQVIFRLARRAEEIPELIGLNLVSQISDFLDIPLALALLVLVNEIHAMQTTQRRRIESEGEVEAVEVPV
ncbi:DUF4328 domain-containing protein [Dokdonella sp.]|uniref:DUF4328 domain-containing protein n=1 Tax=Dokdonella sp. TaxID=2291710 RepID=UPI0035278468